MSRIQTRATIYYAVMAVILLILVTMFQQNFLPEGLSHQIGHNSEAFLFAILVPAEIQLLRGRARTPGLLGIMGGIGLVLIGFGLLLKSAGLAPTLVTLNEPVIASGFVMLYLCLPRSRAIAIAVTVLTVLYVITFFNTGFVLDQAESLVPLALVGPALDIFDRTILQPSEPDEPALRVAWMVALLVVVIALIPAASWAREDLHGGPRYTIDCMQRAAEGYWGWLLVHLYFSYWLGSLWRGTQAADHRVGQPVPTA
jgi:hypothetical protein